MRSRKCQLGAAGRVRVETGDNVHFLIVSQFGTQGTLCRFGRWWGIDVFSLCEAATAELLPRDIGDTLMTE